MSWPFDSLRLPIEAKSSRRVRVGKVLVNARTDSADWLGNSHGCVWK